ncbi:MAG: UDP-N-acetylmuramoyl-tripeptide--D-alanyl-D-alanine ligase [Endomicrobium sp.]|jgi:UDP-N-acetylmuramoyl-tripeptide--D-alanyl-D-alanine ligase|nr:UDP-N-acetylmuramoyl-tripeptide--D-alanyl-D-alanine ligase [Endomicrobium sp.]
MLYLYEIANIVSKKKKIKNQFKIPIKGISIDSRTIKKGEIYIAIKGKNYDGHIFISEAINKGAIAIICNKFYKLNVPIFVVTDTLKTLGEIAKLYISKFNKTKIIAITGSNGKTTTKEILFSILSRKHNTIVSKQNFNNRIGLPLSIFRMNHKIKYAIFELGTSLCGEIKILSEILKPNIGIITNIGLSHLKSFINSYGIFKEKKQLFDSIKKLKYNSFIVINNDDKFLKYTYGFNKKQHKSNDITFAIKNIADVTAKDIKLYTNKIEFRLHYKSDSIMITIYTQGKFNIMNALAAASCAIKLGFSLYEIKIGIEKFQPIMMRMENIFTNKGIVLINDSYNSNPISLKKSIEAVLEHYKGKNINLVIGDMNELGIHSIMYHNDIGDFIKNKPIRFIYLIGKMAIYIKNKLNEKRTFYCTDEIMLFKKLIQTPLDNNSVFLFKASRSMNLEKICKNFFCFINKQ